MTERWSAVERTGDSVVAEGLTAQIGPRTADAIGRRIVGPFTRALSRTHIRAWEGQMRVSLKPASAEIFVVESVLIAPEGELDIASLGEFRAALSEAASKAADRLVVDLSRLESIDSSGLGALVELDNRLRRENRRLAVVAPGGTAAALLMNLSGVQNRLVTYETEEAAIEGVS